MRERLRTVLSRLRDLDGPELTPVTWTIAVFLGAILADGVRARAARSPLSSAEADLLAVLVIVAFVALSALLAILVRAVRDR